MPLEDFKIGALYVLKIFILVDVIKDFSVFFCDCIDKILRYLVSVMCPINFTQNRIDRGRSRQAGFSSLFCHHFLYTYLGRVQTFPSVKPLFSIFFKASFFYGLFL